MSLNGDKRAIRPEEIIDTLCVLFTSTAASSDNFWNVSLTTNSFLLPTIMDFNGSPSTSKQSSRVFARAFPFQPCNPRVKQNRLRAQWGTYFLHESIRLKCWLWSVSNYKGAGSSHSIVLCYAIGYDLEWHVTGMNPVWCLWLFKKFERDI